MRLSTSELQLIKNNFTNIFGDKSQIYLFGSRVDDNRVGGDIDLFIKLSKPISTAEQLQKKINFLNTIYSELGEQKIDIIFSKNSNSLIENEAISKGILI